MGLLAYRVGAKRRGNLQFAFQVGKGRSLRKTRDDGSETLQKGTTGQGGRSPHYARDARGWRVKELAVMVSFPNIEQLCYNIMQSLTLGAAP